MKKFFFLVLFQITEEITLRSTGSCGIPTEATAISIENCEKVSVIEESFKGLKGLRSIALANIKQLSIKSYGFHWNETLEDYPQGLSINLTNVTIPDVPTFAFKGRIDSVIFDRSYVAMLRSFSFSSISKAERIEFQSTNVANIEAQAFKKFTISKFIIRNSRFNVIPSRFLVDVYVDNLFKIENTFIDVIRTLAFKIYNPKEVLLINSRINKVEAEAFYIKTRGDVVIQNNIFDSIENEAFRGISVEKYIIQQSGKQKFKFQNNTISYFREKSLFLDKSSFDIKTNRIMIDEICTCDHLNLWAEIITGESDVENDKKKKKSTDENVYEIFWCHIDDRKELDLDYVSGKYFYEDYCTTVLSSIYFFVIIITATALSLTVLIVFIVCCVKHKKKWDSVPTSPRDADKNFQGKVKGEKHPKAKKKDGKEVINPESAKAIIVPDGRTYKETEFHVIVEKAEPLDDNGFIPYTITRERSHSQIN